MPVSHLFSKSVRVCGLIHLNLEPIRCVSNRADRWCVSRAPLSVWSDRLSFFMMRFVFSPAWENPSESTIVRRTSYRSSLGERYFHSYGFQCSTSLWPLSSRRLAEINGLRTSATSQVVFMLLPALVLTRNRRCPKCSMCDPLAPLKPTPLCDSEVASRGYSVHTDLGSTFSTAPESTNASNSFRPRLLSVRSVTELMVAMGSWPQSRPNKSLSASLDGSVPISS